MENSQTTSDGTLVDIVRRQFSCAIGLVLFVSAADAQPALRLKGWKQADSAISGRPVVTRTRAIGRSHFLVQFASQPGAQQIGALQDRGAAVLSYVPDSTLSISMRDTTDVSGLGIQWIGKLQPSQKISPELAGKLVAGPAPPVLIEFYSDVLESDARAIAAGTGALIHDNPDLLPHHLLIEGTVDQVRQLADWDEVSYIFPASSVLLQGLPVHGCAGALTAAGPVAQEVPLVGDGWSGPGHGSASLNYSFVYLTQQDPADSVESEIERAYAEWANYVQVTFTQTSDSTAPQTLAVLFATGPHGDGYPFSGTTVLAHTFYPYPLNPEPIAGNQHFNDAESWKIGTDVDVFSVALHETGHALGLGHSDNPADVMYPYYRMVSGLSPDDIAAIQQQYPPTVTTPVSNNPATPTPTPAPTPMPAPTALTLTIQPTATTTTASSIALTGTALGGSGQVQVNWSTNQGAAGAAQVTSSQNSASWTIAAITLSPGVNVITVTASDAVGDQASQSVTMTTPLPPADNPTSGTTSPPATPSPDGGAPTLTILSPAMTMVATSAASIVVSGIARDNLGIAEVTWTSSAGGSGGASGTSNWATGPISLYEGMTTITIYATDTAGNQSWRSISITRN
jgi:hypothetical protein